ncbi:unnamed protein product [Pleuronectes platessa]|uniref:Uncharacterized protein n=1 Tax=Pleuronectes platessa TaxID=8262 RepID=A0A9N7TJQ0_PLEPL|nr:unnamed protein product [Pleuronectes platessa]
MSPKSGDVSRWSQSQRLLQQRGEETWFRQKLPKKSTLGILLHVREERRSCRLTALRRVHTGRGSDAEARRKRSANPLAPIHSHVKPQR